MADFPYTTVPGKLKTLLDKIRDIGVPPKAHNQWLKSIGFTSSNDSSLLTILKYLGLADQTGVPTQRWTEYRGNLHGRVLAEAIQDGYSELYAVYPDAHSRTAEELEHVFSTNSTAGKQVIGKTATTFRNLCELADFWGKGDTKEPHPPRPLKYHQNRHHLRCTLTFRFTSPRMRLLTRSTKSSPVWPSTCTKASVEGSLIRRPGGQQSHSLGYHNLRQAS